MYSQNNMLSSAHIYLSWSNILHAERMLGNLNNANTYQANRGSPSPKTKLRKKMNKNPIENPINVAVSVRTYIYTFVLPLNYPAQFTM